LQRIDFMVRFEYEITKHPAEEFTQLIYFCTDEGDCTLSDLPQDEVAMLLEILNKRGDQGWELIEVFFGKDGIVAFWKRAI
jgi:hypothetical protein